MKVQSRFTEDQAHIAHILHQSHPHALASIAAPHGSQRIIHESVISRPMPAQYRHRPSTDPVALASAGAPHSPTTPGPVRSPAKASATPADSDTAPIKVRTMTEHSQAYHRAETTAPEWAARHHQSRSLGTGLQIPLVAITLRITASVTSIASPALPVARPPSRHP